MRDTVDVALSHGWQDDRSLLCLSIFLPNCPRPHSSLSTCAKPHVQPTTLFITDMALNLNLLALDLYTDIYLKPNNLQVLQIVTVDL